MRPGARTCRAPAAGLYSPGMRRALLVLGLVGAPLVLGCGALRQNLRNQFLSYRGAWQCQGGKCKVASMKRSIKQHREGETDITHVTMHNQVAMVFNAGAPPDSFSARISCGGDSADVPAERIKAPGQHDVAGQKDSYAIIVRPKDYPFAKGCKQFRVRAHATWEGGKKTYDAEAGLEPQ